MQRGCMNSSTKDLARIAASVARESTSRASRVDAHEAQRNSMHFVRARLHGVTTVGLAVAVAVLAFKWSDERDLRRQAETRVTEVRVARLPTALPGYRSTPWAVGVPSILRAGATHTGAAQVASSQSSKTVPGSQDRAVDFPLQQLRKQLSDAAARSALRGQQRSAVLQMYGGLLRSWHLPADKSDRVLDLLAEQQLVEMDRSLAQSTRSAPGVPASDNSDELNAVLTDQQRAQLTKQQASLSERLTVSALSDELSLAQMPLTDSQRDQLTQIMYDERTAIPAPDVQGSAASSPDAQRALADWESALDQRVQERAATFLTDAQQSRYEQFMTRQRDARNVFASFEVAQSGDNAGGGAPPSATVPPQGP
jgi:hypothetical protein